MPTPEDPAEGAFDGWTVAVLGGRPALARAVRGRLEELGAVVRHVATDGVVGDREWPQVGHELGPDVDTVIDLAGDEVRDVTTTGWWPALSRTFAVLREVHGAWSTPALLDSTRYLAVTRTGGHAGTRPGSIPAPLGGLWAGLAKGLPHEFPTTSVRVLDLEETAAEEDARSIVRELLHPGPFEIGYASGTRHHLRVRPAPVPPPRRALTEGDLVLVTGGGRGIGWALAEHLAERFGCTVVVTGRDDLLALADPWTSEDPQTLAELRAATLRDAAARSQLAAGRQTVKRMMQRSAVSRALSAAAARGLPVRYARADVTDAAEVAELVAGLPARPRIVVHNAGVDEPGRLATKEPGAVWRTVSVKVGGFLALYQALQDGRPPEVWCNVGSMTGRWGGLLGQLEYGAANEALARLAQWSAHDPDARRAGTTTVTMAWPTWERLGGLISNFEATLAYMAAMPVAEGLDHWESELLGADSGESGFLAPLGAGIVPTVLRGYDQPRWLPGAVGLGTAALTLAGPVEWGHGRFRTSLQISPSQWPVLGDVTWAGTPVLVVGWGLELALAAARWTTDPAAAVPVAFRAVRADLAALRCPDDTTPVELRAWRVAGKGRPRTRVVLAVGGGPALSTDVVFEGRPVQIPTRRDQGPPSAGVPDLRVPANHLPLEWAGRVLPVAPWRMSARDEQWRLDLTEPAAQSQCLLDPVVMPHLPIAAVETVIRTVVQQVGPARPSQGNTLMIPAVDLVDLARTVAGLRMHGTRAVVTDAVGARILILRNAQLIPAQDARAQHPTDPQEGI